MVLRRNRSLSNSKRSLRVESLERRELFAGDAFHYASTSGHNDDSLSGIVAHSSDTRSHGSEANDHNELKADIRGASGERVKVEIENNKLEIKIERAAPQTS